MKPFLFLMLTLIMLTTTALAADDAPSVQCLDRKYNFLDSENYVAIAGGAARYVNYSGDEFTLCSG